MRREAGVAGSDDSEHRVIEPRIGMWVHDAASENMGAQAVQFHLVGEAEALGNFLCPQH